MRYGEGEINRARVLGWGFFFVSVEVRERYPGHDDMDIKNELRVGGGAAEVEQVEDPGRPRRTGNCDYVDKIKSRTQRE